MSYETIPIDKIDPSPFQHRKSFDSGKLRDLASTIERDGLLHAITVRQVNGRYQLIAGERRWRAVRDYTEAHSIDAHVVDWDDIRARRMCATENIERDDLSHPEEVGAIVELIDAEMIDDEEYAALADDVKTRVSVLLGRLETGWRNDADKLTEEAQAFTHKFVCKVESIFEGLPKSKQWRTFYNHDLPLVKDIDPDVERWAIANKLNKSQTKALKKAVKETPELKEKLEEKADEDGKIELVSVDSDGETESLKDMSAKEMKEDISWRLEETNDGELKEEKERQKALEVTRRIDKDRVYALLNAMSYWARLPDDAIAKDYKEHFNRIFAPTVNKKDVEQIIKQLKKLATEL